jgi:hypothetical protein
MRIGFFEEQRLLPTFVLMPVYPSTQSIGVGHPLAATTDWSAVVK